MKNLSYRIWVLVLGIAVAAVILVALVFNGSSGSPFSGAPSVTQKKTATAPAVLLQKVIKKINASVGL
jgi:hypothetical protein